MADKKVSSKSFPQSFAHAWEPLKSSFTFSLLGYATIVEASGFALQWQSNLKQLDFWPAWASTVNLIIYLAIVVLFGVGLFRIAEKGGEFKEATEINSEVSRFLHAAIHYTREKLPTIIDVKEDRNAWDIYKMQMGYLQDIMREMTKHRCQTDLFILQENAIDSRLPGLVPICAGPGGLVDRLDRRVTLPLNLGIASQSVARNTIVVCDDILTSDQFWPQEERERYAKLYRTIVVSPIIVDGRPWGVLTLDWREPGKYSAEKHEAILKCFTDLLALAVQIYERDFSLLLANHTEDHDQD